MKKALIVANTARFIVSFELDSIRILQEMGFEVHCASNFNSESDIAGAENKLREKGAAVHQIDICRSPFRAGNVRALKDLKKLIKDEGFALVHCHTPSGGVLARLAAESARKKGTKVIYTVHGFHFYKGAPLLNWAVYYPVERFFARMTDVLITINEEDHRRAHGFKAKKVLYVPGVGVDTAKTAPCSEEEKTELRRKLGLPEDRTVLLSVGDINKNKNHAAVLNALTELKDDRIFYVVCGSGELLEAHKEYCRQSGIADQVRFAGFCSNIADYYHAADAFVFPSYREGLSVALMEAMACGLPVLCSRIRGNTDLVKNEAFLADPGVPGDWARGISMLADLSAKDRLEVSSGNRKTIEEGFSLGRISSQMRSIYGEMFG